MINGYPFSEFEADMRRIINPVYADVRGTESYERKRFLDEIDRLRKLIPNENTLPHNDHPMRHYDRTCPARIKDTERCIWEEDEDGI